MKLSKAEEQLMEYIWREEKVFLKELLERYPDPKPAKTTLATLLKRLQDKGVVGYTLFGNSRQYHALIEKSAYFSNHLGALIKNYFEDSALKFASFFTRSSNLSYEELQSLRNLIDEQMKEQKDD